MPHHCAYRQIPLHLSSSVSHLSGSTSISCSLTTFSFPNSSKSHPPHLQSPQEKKKKKKTCLFYFKIAAFMIHFPHRFLSGIGDVTAFFPFVSISGWIKTPKLYPSKKKKKGLNKNTSKTLQTTVLFCMLDITQTKEP